jgi:hypothetical protein
MRARPLPCSRWRSMRVRLLHKLSERPRHHSQSALLTALQQRHRKCRCSCQQRRSSASNCFVQLLESHLDSHRRTVCCIPGCEYWARVEHHDCSWSGPDCCCWCVCELDSESACLTARISHSECRVSRARARITLATLEVYNTDTSCSVCRAIDAGSHNGLRELQCLFKVICYKQNMWTCFSALQCCGVQTYCTFGW